MESFAAGLQLGFSNYALGVTIGVVTQYMILIVAISAVLFVLFMLANAIAKRIT